MTSMRRFTTRGVVAMTVGVVALALAAAWLGPAEAQKRGLGDSDMVKAIEALGAAQILGDAYVKAHPDAAKGPQGPRPSDEEIQAFLAKRGDEIARYQAATGRDIDAAYWALAAQRNTRILGVFCRLWKRDGKDRYKAFQPRMWGLLERDLAHPALAPVKAWFDENIPHSARAAAWKEATA